MCSAHASLWHCSRWASIRPSRRCWKSSASAGLSFQQIHRLVHVLDAEEAGERRVLLRDGLIHFPRHAAIAEVARDRGAQLGDVERFYEIHLEHGADSRAE